MGLTGRAVFIGLIATALVSFIVAWAELVAQSIQIGLLQLPPVVIAVFFLVLVANYVVRRLGAAGLRPPEMVVIYCMMLLGAMLSSRGLMERLLPLMVGVNYFADDGNRWRQIYFSHIPRWLVPWDPAGPTKQKVVVDFYQGLPAGESIPWGAWIGPLLAWAALIALVLLTFLCLATLLRKQWADNEKLAFPLARLPIEMLGEGAGSRGFFTNRLMWIGFAIPVLIHTLNGLSGIYPALPAVPVNWGLHQYFHTKPWTAIWYMPLQISFAAIGFFYFLPAELLFSFWFFYLFGHAQAVAGATLGFDMPVGQHSFYMFMTYETAGAFFVLAGYLLYAAWPHLRRTWRAEAGADEMIPYRWAYAGLAVGVGGTATWCYLTGMAPWVALCELGIYFFVQAIVMARATSEGGLLMTEGSFTPLDALGVGLNKGALGTPNLTALVWTNGLLTRDLRGISLTAFLDGSKVADSVRLSRRRLAAAFAISAGGTFVIAAAIQLWLAYSRGALSFNAYTHISNPVQFFREHQPYVEGQETLTGQGPLFFVLGGLFTAALGALRMRFYWWPLHPLGFAMAGSWSLIVYWFDMVVAWVVKGGIVRFGGPSLYVRARPFFLGLIFGEFFIAVVWTLLASGFGLPTPFIAFD